MQSNLCEHALRYTGLIAAQPCIQEGLLPRPTFQNFLDAVADAFDQELGIELPALLLRLALLTPYPQPMLKGTKNVCVQRLQDASQLCGDDTWHHFQSSHCIQCAACPMRPEGIEKEYDLFRGFGDTHSVV